MKLSQVLFAVLFIQSSLASANNSFTQTVLCSAEATTQAGKTFIYQLHAPARAFEDGSFTFDDEQALIDVVTYQLPSIAVAAVLVGSTLEYSDAGMGHARFNVPASKLGLSVDVSYLGRALSVKHKISDVEILQANGKCNIL